MKNVHVGPGSIVTLILVLVFLSILLSVAKSTIPTAATAYSDLAGSQAGNTSIYGADASAFATNARNYVGWFWVIGPFVLVIVAVVAIFLKGHAGR